MLVVLEVGHHDFEKIVDVARQLRAGLSFQKKTGQPVRLDGADP